MSKIKIIIQREFNTRVRKRMFVITTILTPLLMVSLMVIPVILAKKGSAGATEKRIVVVDNSGIVGGQLKNKGKLTFENSDKTLEQLRSEKPKVFGILVIGSDVLTNPSNVQLYTYSSSTIDIEGAISGSLEKIIESEKIKAYNIENLSRIMKEVKTNVSVQAFRIDESGNEKQSSSKLSMGMAYVFGFLIYIFIFIYGVMVMQAVIEEKSSKVIEILVSSVRPFELMMGKILGIALVAITQFMIWIVLIFILGTAAMQYFGADMASAAGAAPGMSAGGGSDILPALRSMTDAGFLLKTIGSFICYFLGGYLLYASMFAALGSAVDSPGDAHQLQMPATIPLIIAIMVLMNVMRDPNSTMALWFSMIPFTSPIIMMARIPYGVPAWQIVVSLAILAASFVAMVWFAAKIYRVGIFMTGKKPTIQEIVKWARYKS